MQFASGTKTSETTIDPSFAGWGRDGTGVQVGISTRLIFLAGVINLFLGHKYYYTVYLLFAEELISAIHRDIEDAKRLTADPINRGYMKHSFFSNQ